MKAVSGRELREMKSKAGPMSLAELMPKGVAISRLIEHIATQSFDRTGQHGTLDEGTGNPGNVLMDKVGMSVGMVRDIDGNVIHVSKDDRPFVVVDQGEILYVKVNKVRITPKGVQFNSQCTAENLDGLEEVLLVEPLPTIEAAY